jgi:hypothetical protein
MAKQTIGLGAAANDGTGDNARASGQKINENFDELYGRGAVVVHTGTTYTFVLADDFDYHQFSNAAAITLTVPTNATVAFPIGTEIEIEQSGAGVLTVAAASGVTINSRGGDLSLAGQFAVAGLKKTATNTWTLTGDL